MTDRRRTHTRSGKTVIIILAVTALAALLYVALRQQACCQDTNTNTENNSVANAQTVTNTNNTPLTEAQQTVLQQEGFWIPALDNENEYAKSTFENTTSYDFGGGDYVSNMPASAASTIKASVGAPQETNITLDGVTATEITGTSQKDGSHVTYILIPQDGRTLFARGSAEFLEALKSSIQLVQ